MNKNITLAHHVIKMFPGLANYLIYFAGFFLRISADMDTGLRFIYMHQVQPWFEKSFTKLVILLQKQCRFVSTAEAADLIYKNKTNDDIFLHLSFDDGFSDNFKAAHILKDLEIPATFFIVTHFIDGYNSGLADNFRLKYEHEKPLTWDQVGKINEWGMEIGSHSLSHANFSLLSEEPALNELQVSKKRIEKMIGTPVVSFSFPYGRRTDFRKQNIETARRTGYKYIFSTELSEYNSKCDFPEFFGRFGAEPFLSDRAMKILCNGLLKICR